MPLHVLCTMNFPDAWLDRLRLVSSDLVITQYPAQSVADVPPELWARTDVLYSGAVFPHVEHAPRLRWVQLDTSGVDHVMRTPLWGSDVAITTLNGVAPTTMAEFSLMMMLALAHRMPLMLRHQVQADWPSPSYRWNMFMPLELRGATVGIVGYGSIGQEIGRMTRALGMRVLGMRRGSTRPATFQIRDQIGPSLVEPDRSYPPEHLHAMLAECDYVVLIVPYTAATHHLIDAAAFAVMKPSAFLINVARGGVVDEAALCHALHTGGIAGAALDVFEHEPLPADHPLWRMDNVIISPHVAGYTPHYYDRVFELFAENLGRFMAGMPLLNLVSRERQY